MGERKRWLDDRSYEIGNEPSAETDVPPCEVHAPGRDQPSPWCGACRLSGASVTPPGEGALDG